MTSQNSTQTYIDWAKERLDEIEATLAAFEAGARTLQADARSKATTAVTRVQAARDAFRKEIAEQKQATQADLALSRKKLEVQWSAFETSAQTYLEATSERLKDGQAAFLARTLAQRDAWQAAIDMLQKSAVNAVAGRRAEIETTLNDLKADAEAAKAKLDKLHKAGGVSWDAMRAALSETRTALDRAQETALQAFKHVK